MKHILAATDLSPRADRAVERAFRMAGETGAALTVLTVTDEDIPEPLASRLRPETEAHLRQICDGLSQGGAIPFEAKVIAGDPSVDIPRIASEVGADIVLMGTHRRRAFLDAFRETTLERVVRLSAPTVLLIREPADHAYGRVLAALDFSPAASAALAAARWVAPQAEIRAFHAVHVPFTGYAEGDPRGASGTRFLREAEAARRRWLDINPLPDGVAVPEILEGALGGVFGAELSRTAPNLIALGAHARHGIADMVLGSFTRDLVRDPPADLLIAKP